MPQAIDNQWVQCPFCHTKHDRFTDCPNPDCKKVKELQPPKPKPDIFANVIWPEVEKKAE